MAKRITMLALNAILFSIIAGTYLHSFNKASPETFAIVAPIETFISSLSPISAVIFSSSLHILAAILSIKCFGRTIWGRTFVGGFVMHFFMETYGQVATLAGLSRYGICDGKCYDKVPFGSTVGMFLMRRLEEDGWGGKVTWISLGKAGMDWLFEDVKTATVFQWK
jgi:hypothetical protein